MTLDSDPYSGSLIDLGHWSNIEILRGNSITLLSSVESIDLFLHDSNHDSDYDFSEFVTIEKVLSDNSWVIADNSHISDSLLEWSRQQGREFIFFKEESINHWHPGDGIGLSIPSRTA